MAKKNGPNSAVCQNYANRVKGNRPVGDKVFMQGGVCYNRAVPMAMAALTGKAIIVGPALRSAIRWNWLIV